LLLGEPYCSYLRGQRFYLDPGDPPVGYKCETLLPGWLTGQSCGVGRGERVLRALGLSGVHTSVVS